MNAKTITLILSKINIVKVINIKYLYKCTYNNILEDYLTCFIKLTFQLSKN